MDQRMSSMNHEEIEASIATVHVFESQFRGSFRVSEAGMPEFSGLLEPL